MIPNRLVTVDNRAGGGHTGFMSTNHEIGTRVRVTTGITRHGHIGTVVRHTDPQRGTSTERSGLRLHVVRFVGGPQTDMGFDPRELEVVR